ncbi:MAG TPA: RluA family pseudouridine synthase [Gemmatimonadetes bacterium]|nr:RluA family pseudouridine synthase [Gemmatimonadota bacterium]HIC14282.1 RluA family pseudouridine synthase [Gemmatimonadota bacterium]
MEAQTHKLTVRETEVGRVDRILANRLGMSRTRVHKLLTAGLVSVNGEPAKKSLVVAFGDELEVVVPPAQPVEMAPEEIPLDIVYEDKALVVVHKPAGMVVHPAPGHRSGTMVNALLHHVSDLSGVGGRLRPGIVHRLDQHTSGLLVVAKTDEAHHSLSDALRERRVRRIYQAVVWGHLTEPKMTIEASLGRDPKDRKRMAVREDGRVAISHLRVREQWERADFLDVRLQTGRTHQIRVHLAYIGHPVVADPVYGVGWERGMGGPQRAWANELARRVPRQFLHAAELGFEHPVTGIEMRFEVDLPDDLSGVVSWARGEIG